MNQSASATNLININDAHCELLSQQINLLEIRVREMETRLLNQATRLHDAVTEKLDNLFDENTIVEFDAFPGEEGSIKLSKPRTNRSCEDRSCEVFETIKATREQLQLLNQTIEKIQLAR